MPCLLILSCGTSANWHITKTLTDKFRGMFRLVGTDTNTYELVASAANLDAFYTVPPSSDSSFMLAIENVLSKEHPDYILPSFDCDQQLFSSSSTLLKKYGVKSLSTPAETLEIYSDKVATNKACKSACIPVPKFYTVSDVSDDTQYFIKPIHGVGSIGAHVASGSEIKDLHDSHNYIIQELCRGPERTLECFYYHGRISSVCRERIVAKSGVCTKARIFKSPKLQGIAKRFAESFKVPMIFNLQFMENAVDEPVVTDVNLRTAGGMSLSYAAGWDEVSALAKVLLGKSEDEIFSTLPEYIPEQYVVRVYEDHVTKIGKNVVAFDLDGTLVDSRKRHRVVLDEILRKHDVAVDTADLIQFKSKNRNNVQFLMEKGLDEDQAKSIQKEWVENIESDAALLHDKVYSDTISMLNQYDGWHRILLTARANKEGLEAELDRLNLHKYFGEVIVIAPGKSAKDEKAKILAMKNAQLMIGDTSSDYKAALQADVAFQFHENGFHDRETVYAI